MLDWTFFPVVEPFGVIEEGCLHLLTWCQGEDHKICVILEEEGNVMWLGMDNGGDKDIRIFVLELLQDEITMGVFGPY